jgi:hypothetical protein
MLAGWDRALIAGATLLFATAHAQPSSLDRYRQAPTVLAAGHAPGQCVDMDNNSMGENVILWQCWPGWNQNFQTRPAAAGKVQITLGGYNCLTSPSVSGQRVTMKLCDPGLPAQQWTASGTRLIDSAGLCLDAYGAGKGNGTWVIMWACTPAAQNQNWAFTTLREEQKKANQIGQGRAPGFQDAQGFSDGMLAELVEQDRPRFQKRNLTGAERAEISRLMAPYRKYDVLKQLDFNNRPNWTGVKMPWSTISRLAKLAESGDKDAMLAAMTAMRIGLAIGQTNRYRHAYDPVDDNGAFSKGDQAVAWERLHRLTRIWSAHYWQRHGKHRLAAYAFSSCWPVNVRCGYTYEVPPMKSGENKMLYVWARDGDGKHYHDILNITFWPVDGGPEWRKARFETLIAAMISDGLSWGPTADDHAWLAWYSSTTGQEAIYDNAWMITWFDRNRYNHKSERQYEIAANRRAMEKTWEQQFAFNNLLPQAQTALLGMSRTLGPEYLVRFASKYDVETESDVKIICDGGSPNCLLQDTLLAQRQARFAAATAQAEAERMALARFGTGALPSAYAMVRNYDQQGNYLGTTVDTVTGAELSGAKPQ